MKKLYLLLPILFLIYWGCLGDMDFGSGSGNGSGGDFNFDFVYDYDEGTDTCETVTGDTINLWGVDYSVDCTTELDLSNSGLTGEIPPEIGNLTNLSYLNLEDNQLTGSIPPEIDNLTKLDVGCFDPLSNKKCGLFLSNNQLSGEIPESICNFDFKYSVVGNFTSTTPYNFSISNNKFCPPYPSCVEDFVGEQDMCSCGFDDDDVVDLWGNCYSIEYTTVINLPDSGLTGEIPYEIGQLTNLFSFGLSNNQLTGSIPPEIGNLTDLTELDLRGNQLTGSIPSEIGNLTNLTSLNLYGNQLTGSIPSEIRKLTNLTFLNLSNNQLTGEIPGIICDLTNLTWNWMDVNIMTTPVSSISNNQLCPPYPSCVEDYVGEQDTSDCP